MYIHGSKQTPDTPPTSSDEDSSGSSDDAEAKKKKGNRAIGKKKYPKAIKYYTKAIKIDPKGASYRLNRAIANAAIELWKDAEEDSVSAVELGDPPSAKSHYQLARARLCRGRCFEARDAVDAALVFFPEEASLKRLAAEINREIAKREAKHRRMEAEPKPAEAAGGRIAAKPFLDCARAAHQAGQIEETVSLLQKSRQAAKGRGAEDQRTEISAVSLLGRCNMQLRKWPEAVESFEALVALEDEVFDLNDRGNREAMSNAYNNLGLAYKSAGRLREAADALAKAYHRATNGDDQVATTQCAQILQNSGQCLRAGKKFDEARRFYERALGIGQRLRGVEHSSNALNHLCIARCRRDTGELREAIQAYTKACEIWAHKDPKECLAETPEVPNEQRLADLQQECKAELAQLVMTIEQAREAPAEVVASPPAAA